MFCPAPCLCAVASSGRWGPQQPVLCHCLSLSVPGCGALCTMVVPVGCLQSLLPLSGLPSKSKLGVGVRPLITGAGCCRGPALAESLCQHWFSPGPGSAAEPPEERVSSAVGTDSCPCPGGWGLQATAISETVPATFHVHMELAPPVRLPSSVSGPCPAPRALRGSALWAILTSPLSMPRLYRCRRAEGSCLQ